MLLCYTSATGNIGQELLDLSDFKVHKLWQNCYLYFSFSFLPPPFFSLALIISSTLILLHFSLAFLFVFLFAFALSHPNTGKLLQDAASNQRPWKAPLCLSTHFPLLGFHPVGYKYPKNACVCADEYAQTSACTRGAWKHMKSVFACVSLCLQVIFCFPLCSLGEICRLDAAGWLCALRGVSGWIMGASGSASGSGNSKCVKRRDCPRSTRSVGCGSERAARRTPRASCRLQGQQKHVAPFLLIPCKSVNYRLPPRNASNYFPAALSTNALQQMFKINICTLDLVTDCTWSCWTGWSGAGLLLLNPPWFEPFAW